MPGLWLNLPSPAPFVMPEPRGRKRVTILSTARRVTLPITSPEVEHTDLASDWQQVPRPGKAALLRKAGPKLQTFRLQVTFELEQNNGPIEQSIRWLREMSDDEQPLAIAYGALEAGLPCRLTEFTVTSRLRKPVTQELVRAEASLTFVAMKLDPSPPQAQQPKPSTAKPGPVRAAPKPAAPTRRIYTVRKGDTLSAIAVRYYHNANDWHRIATANKLRNPNRIVPGQRLVIP